MRALVIVLAIGCGGATQAKPISNTAETPPAPAPTPNAPTFATERIAGATEPGMGVMQGQIIGATSGPLVGATVVIASPSLTGQMVAITDEAGRFTLSPLPPGTYEVTIYYADRRFAHAVEVTINQVVRLAVHGWPDETLELDQ